MERPEAACHSLTAPRAGTRSRAGVASDTAVGIDRRKSTQRAHPQELPPARDRSREARRDRARLDEVDEAIRRAHEGAGESKDPRAPAATRGRVP